MPFIIPLISHSDHNKKSGLNKAESITDAVIHTSMNSKSGNLANLRIFHTFSPFPEPQVVSLS